MPRILVVDDDTQVRETMESLIGRRGYTCVGVANLSAARDALSNGGFDIAFLDVRLPDGNGLDLLPYIKEMPASPEVIILTGQGDPDGAELAIQGGIWDYLVKPSSNKQITLSLERALKYHEEKQSKTETVALNLENVISVDPAIRGIFDRTAMAATSDANVLITGETGTGKELFSRIIHANSARNTREFVVVDCASLTENLLESTLFGHKKGAFTGAQSDHPGLIRLADKGTLFLDEVGEMPLSLQKSFLRVLQERRFRPLGETREVKSDFRLISATNKDLEAMTADGSFRGDLLFRLKTIHLDLPPLRRRREDIKALTVHYVNKLCSRYESPLKGFDSEFFDVLEAYDWPGNVRELFNVLERAFIAAGKEQTLYTLHLPHDLRIKVTRRQLEDRHKPDEDGERSSSVSEDHAESVMPEGTLLSLRDFKEQAERHYLETLRNRTESDVKRMIEISGLSRSHLYALLKKNDVSL
jgi:two-component system NtrC family response regulator